VDWTWPNASTRWTMTLILRQLPARKVTMAALLGLLEQLPETAALMVWTQYEPRERAARKAASSVH